MAAHLRIGIVGYGFIAKDIVSRIRTRTNLFELAFVHCRDRTRAEDVSDTDFLADIAGFGERQPDLVVEAAHPAVTENHGAAFLSRCDYLPMSTGGLLDADRRRCLQDVAARHGTRLLLPAGALIGGEELSKRTLPWDKVRIVFRKHPDNIDFSGIDLDPTKIGGATVVYEGPVAEIARLFPRNVNTMVTAALLSTGPEDCQGVLIADPDLDCAVAEVEAWSSDGGSFRTEKRQPATGVSGTEMCDSAWYSICRALGVTDGTWNVV